MRKQSNAEKNLLYLKTLAFGTNTSNRTVVGECVAHSRYYTRRAQLVGRETANKNAAVFGLAMHA
jgi:hypothetical protein